MGTPAPTATFKSVQTLRDAALGLHRDAHHVPAAHHLGLPVAKDGVGSALSDTPLPSHPGSPRE